MARGGAPAAPDRPHRTTRVPGLGDEIVALCARGSWSCPAAGTGRSSARRAAPSWPPRSPSCGAADAAHRAHAEGLAARRAVGHPPRPGEPRRTRPSLARRAPRPYVVASLWCSPRRSRPVRAAPTTRPTRRTSSPTSRRPPSTRPPRRMARQATAPRTRRRRPRPTRRPPDVMTPPDAHRTGAAPTGATSGSGRKSPQGPAEAAGCSRRAALTLTLATEDGWPRLHEGEPPGHLPFGCHRGGWGSKRPADQVRSPRGVAPPSPTSVTLLARCREFCSRAYSWGAWPRP